MSSKEARKWYSFNHCSSEITDEKLLKIGGKVIKDFALNNADIVRFEWIVKVSKFSEEGERQICGLDDPDFQDTLIKLKKYLIMREREVITTKNFDGCGNDQTLNKYYYYYHLSDKIKRILDICTIFFHYDGSFPAEFVEEKNLKSLQNREFRLYGFHNPAFFKGETQIIDVDSMELCAHLFLTKAEHDMLLKKKVILKGEYFVCQSCCASFEEHETQKYGTESNGSVTSEFCSDCYRNGKFTEPDITLEQMIKKKCKELKSRFGKIDSNQRKNLAHDIGNLKRWSS